MYISSRLGTYVPQLDYQLGSWALYSLTHGKSPSASWVLRCLSKLGRPLPLIVPAGVGKVSAQQLSLGGVPTASSSSMSSTRTRLLMGFVDWNHSSLVRSDVVGEIGCSSLGGSITGKSSLALSLLKSVIDRPLVASNCLVTSVSTELSEVSPSASILTQHWVVCIICRCKPAAVGSAEPQYLQDGMVSQVKMQASGSTFRGSTEANDGATQQNQLC